MSKHPYEDVIDRYNRGVAHDADERRRLIENGLGPKQPTETMKATFDKDELLVEAGIDTRLEEAHAALADMIREGATLEEKLELYNEVLEDALATPSEELTFEDLVFIDEIQIEKARLILDDIREQNPSEVRTLNRIIKRKTSETHETPLAVLEDLVVDHPDSVSDETVEAAWAFELAQAKLAEDLSSKREKPMIAPREYTEYGTLVEEDAA